MENDGGEGGIAEEPEAACEVSDSRRKPGRPKKSLSQDEEARKGKANKAEAVKSRKHLDKAAAKRAKMHEMKEMGFH